MLRQVDGRWALVSKKTGRPLAYYKGEGKPSEEWVKKQEARIQFFKHGGVSEQINEAAYVGNIGAMEMFKFFQKASEEQKKKLKTLIDGQKTKEAWKLVQDVTGVKLHKSVHEEVKPDILPKSGAGAWGTDELVNTYKDATPGQERKLKTFKEFRK